jgi:hypothetical protein
MRSIATDERRTAELLRFDREAARPTLRWAAVGLYEWQICATR